MPKTKKEGVVFALLNAFFMAYLMSVYNIALNAPQGLVNSTFYLALKSLPLQLLVAFIFASFLATPLAKKFAFKVASPKESKEIFVILSMQTFTCLIMVGLMSLFAIFSHHLVNSNVFCTFITTYCKNFLMAYPLQIFLVGPLARKIYRIIYAGK